MMDKDIKEMFREKNKVILLNNLKYDLDKNINSLLETIINIFNFCDEYRRQYKFI